MRYFHRLAQNEPVMPLMQAIMRNPELWGSDAPQEKIILRNGSGHDLEEMQSVPLAKRIALALMQTLGGTQLGDISVIKIAPGEKIPAHINPNEVFSRY